MRVSLQAPQPYTPDPLHDGVPASCLDGRGARIVLGSGGFTDGQVVPICATPASLFGPRGACLIEPSGPLIVCDTGHHRMLVWSRTPESDDVAAEIVIGQRDFFREGRNGNDAIGPATLNAPTGIAAGSGFVAVADAWNHRVLLWRGLPRHSNQPADIVLGQADFRSGHANRALAAPRADTLHWCYGVLIHEGRLFVADTGNRRVLVWDSIPDRNGAPADRVLGQRDFVTRDGGSGADSHRRAMRWPHGIAVVDGMLLVADAGTSRILAWREIPSENGAPCDFVLGHRSFEELDHNRGGLHPDARTLNMPSALVAQQGRLLVADTANSRLLGFEADALEMDAPAAFLAGQRNFHEKGENRWNAASRDSLCWPYGVSACGHTLVIADSGNNRILLWDRA
jgi:hypothetical protein